MFKKILNKGRLLKRYLISKYFDINIKIPSENEIYFCFLGEFGYEIISWIPYLLFLKKTGLKINTIGRPGSKVFYCFSDKHIEISPLLITGMWGDKKNYKKVKQELKLKKIIHPTNGLVFRQRIIVNGYEWQTKDIHSKIEEINYEKPDFSHELSQLPFKFEKYVVINNKYDRFKDNEYTTGWKKISPNFFDRQALKDIKNKLLNNGYAVVYNRFIENTAIDEDGGLEDNDIFTEQNTYDMRNWYSLNHDKSENNKMQICVYNKAAFVIAVQGGNVYLPAICKKNIIMLMREGDYIDYTELSRLYKSEIDVFYEPKHILQWLNNILNR